MCEDRGIEQYGMLKEAAGGTDVFGILITLFTIADDKYNAGLFDVAEDQITSRLQIDDKVLKSIIRELYYPNCEYEFSVMPADILGSVYERFLGKTIRLTKGHHAKIEEKPEVRKAGGVYYTPKFIVDYIVENTAGRLVEGKTPKQVEKIRICDPACGSGSFLIGAYQYLLDRHLRYYTECIPGKNTRSPLTPDGNLSTAEKKRILTNNIFGVDIDAQAAEVTKLNLLLKALEGETRASIRLGLELFHERALPNLGNNIRGGNSLIGPDYYDDQLELFPGQLKKINASDGFKQVYISARQEDIGIIKSPVGMPGRAILNEFLEKVRQGKKQPIRCPFKCIRTCDVSSSPYCIILALISAVKGNFSTGYAFAGTNAFRATSIISVKETIATLLKEFRERGKTIPRSKGLLF